ncbi:DgyrCDS13643 [Dimorphilus gyrociliatus]|uniref:DgyrCDS13643 n=1 Tax=Dimorphilus gyrociliatus TaxID=2664684 RepID=A0A7I8WB86_9ANNE|nr:DgyrCDS13643 [Dimorphilus gyrociliatus]
MRKSEALKVHEEVLEWRKSVGSRSEIQASYHSIGTVYLNDQKYDMALDYFKKAMKVQKELSENPELDKADDRNGFNNKHSFAATHSNVGLVHLRTGNLLEAERQIKQALELYTEYFFGEQTLDISYCYHNLGMIYRRLKQYDKTHEYYTKSLNIKLKYLGEKSIDVGTTYMNLATLELARKNVQMFFDYSAKCYEILNECLSDKNHHQIMMAKENYAHGLFLMNRKEESKEIFLETIAVHEERNDFEKGLLVLYKNMIYYLKEQKQFRTIFRFLAPVMKTKLLRAYHYIIMDEVYENLNDESLREDNLCLEYGIEKFPNSIDLLQYSGTKYFDRDFVELRDFTLKIYNLFKKIGKNENLPIILFSQAMLETNREKYAEKAFLLINEGLKIMPDDTEILAMKAYAFCLDKKYQECLDILTMLTENSTKNHSVLKPYFEDILDMGEANDQDCENFLKEVTDLNNKLHKVE